MTDFKYDVAVSFLDEDRGRVAKILKEAPDLQSFFFPNRQVELLSTHDGLVAFKTLFLREARTILVLHRERWGHTDWTRHEADVIAERYLSSGAEIFSLFKLDASPPPIWFPRHRIYGDLNALTSKQAAIVLEERVRSCGGDVRAETAVEMAARLGRLEDLHRTKTAFLRSKEGARAAEAEFYKLRDLLTTAAPQAGCRFEMPNDRVIQLGRGQFYVIVTWSSRFLDTTFASALVVDLWKVNTERRTRQDEYRFDVDTATQAYHWTDHDKDRIVTTDQLAEDCLKILLDLSEKERERALAEERRQERARRTSEW